MTGQGELQVLAPSEALNVEHDVRKDHHSRLRTSGGFVPAASPGLSPFSAAWRSPSFSRSRYSTSLTYRGRVGRDRASLTANRSAQRGSGLSRPLSPSTDPRRRHSHEATLRFATHTVGQRFPVPWSCHHDYDAKTYSQFPWAQPPPVKSGWNIANTDPHVFVAHFYRTTAQRNRYQRWVELPVCYRAGQIEPHRA